jgi:hypothetical protein
MYKKRFAKWNFQKYSKRSASAVRCSKTKSQCARVSSGKARSPRELGSSVPALFRLGHRDELTLLFLTSVRTWSVAFFESVQSGEFLASQQRRPPPKAHLWSSNTQEIDFVVKLVINLLDRGHGDIAGRMTRKAFLLVEDMLVLEGPALVWNLLQIMHHMVTLRHIQLFHILLSHLIALADGQMPKAHPLPTMLRGLRGIVTSRPSAASTPRRSLLSPSASLHSSSIGSDTEFPTTDPWLLSRAFPSVLERAWVLNAEIFFDHFDPRLFQLYLCILWDSSSIGTPAAIVNTATQLFTHIDVQQMLSTTTMASYSKEPLMSTSVAVDDSSMMQRLPTFQLDASPPRNYEMLRRSTIDVLREREDLIISKGPGFDGHASILLRILACLATARALEGLPAISERLTSADYVTMTMSRLQAANVACASRTLLDLDTKHLGGELGAPLDFVERIRAIVALREYANGETHPQVVWEMLLLQEALIAAGKYAEAQEVERDAYSRMENYMQDIPVDSA